MNCKTLGVAGLFEYLVQSGDANELVSFGFYNTTLNVANVPFDYSLILTIPGQVSNARLCFQLAVERNVTSPKTPGVAFRTFRGDATHGWSDWKIL